MLNKMLENLINKIMKRKKKVIVKTTNENVVEKINENIVETANEKIVEIIDNENRIKIGSIISFHRNKHVNAIDTPIIAIVQNKYIVKHAYGKQLDKQTCEQYNLSQKDAYIELSDNELIKK